MLLSAGCFAAALCAAPEARAQDATEEDSTAVSGTGKGIVGGALLGGEIVMIPMGAAGIKPWWPYLVFGGLGSVGGAVGGWAVEQADPPAEAPLYMLAGGLALIIPTVVLAASAITREEYEDSSDPSTLEQQPGGPAGEPGQPGTQPGNQPDGTTVTVETSDARKVRRTKKRRHPGEPLPVALFDLQPNTVRMGVPAVQIKNMYSLEEIAKYGVEQKTEVNIPVVSASF
ncbi:MAG: hypothetical protein HOV80_15450 [Polyangiaceae bacterium]|nr:hypothetical protein [Polyangiaceae bacterium]